MLKSESCERKGAVDRVAQIPGDEIFYGTDIYFQDDYCSFSFTYKIVYQYHAPSRKRQITVMLRDHCKIVGP
jgi:hypothetical protein